MKAKVVRSYRQPAYPDRKQVLDNPVILKQNLPPAWRSLPEMAGAVAVFLAVNNTLYGADNSANTNDNLAVVAPIFLHGDGRGSDGCIVVNPPVFLSEQEAMQIIDQELGQHGIKPVYTGHPLLSTAGSGNTQIQLKPLLKADAWDTNKNVAIEYVSHKDYIQLKLDQARENPTNQIWGSVIRYEFPTAAKYYAKRFETQWRSKAYLGTFYDPLGQNIPAAKQTNVAPAPKAKEKAMTLKEKHDAAASAKKAESQRLLRLQVQDFVKWLQGQGVI